MPDTDTNPNPDKAKELLHRGFITGWIDISYGPEVIEAFLQVFWNDDYYINTVETVIHMAPMWIAEAELEAIIGRLEGKED